MSINADLVSEGFVMDLIVTTLLRNEMGVLRWNFLEPSVNYGV